MRNPLLLLALLILCAPVRADPEAKLEVDRDGAIVAGHWFDILLVVDPKGTPIAEEGLDVKPLPVNGVEFAAAAFPAPDAPGSFTKTFAVRVPAKLAKDAPYEVALALRGKTAAGEPLEARATDKLRPTGERIHVTAAAALKERAVAGRVNAVVVNAKVIDGYHVYGSDTEEGIAILGMLVPAPGARGAQPWTGGDPANPKGDHIEGAFSFEIPFTPTRAGRLEMRVLLEWQACTEFQCDPNGIGYVPFAFDVEGAASAGASPGKSAAGGSSPGTATPDDLESKSLWGLVVLAVGAGIIALLMPCTYPLIPITISFFTKQADASKKSVVPLALAYGAGIVAIFTLIGVAVGTTLVAGETILNVAAGWQLNLVFAFLFLAFGLSLLGLFDIRLPSFFDDLAAKASGTGGYLSVFVMGLTLVITSFTCTVPFVGGLLVYAAKEGHASSAILAMAVFGLTMAIPFVILSLSPKGFQALPKSGEWMKRLKVTLGIVELGLVLKFVSNVDLSKGTFLIDRETFLVLWGVSFLAAGLYLLGFFDLFAKGVKWTLGGGRALAGLLMLGITTLLLSGATGRGLDEVVGPEVGSIIESFLPQFKPKGQEGKYSDAFVAIAHDLDEGVRLAQEKDANIFLHFTGFS